MDNKKEVCPECKGTGYEGEIVCLYNGRVLCEHCHGTGEKK